MCLYSVSVCKYVSVCVLCVLKTINMCVYSVSVCTYVSVRGLCVGGFVEVELCVS